MAGFEKQVAEALEDAGSGQKVLPPTLDSMALLSDCLAQSVQASSSEKFLPLLHLNDFAQSEAGSEPASVLKPQTQSYAELDFQDAPDAGDILQGQNKVFLVGDLHGMGLDDTRAKDLVSNMMEQITAIDPIHTQKPVLVLEPMSENLQQMINSLDANNPDSETMKAISDCLKNSIKPVPPNEDVIKSYQNMVLEARKAGVEIICPEPALPQYPELFDQQFGEILKDGSLNQPLQDYLNDASSEQSRKAQEKISAALEHSGYNDEQIKQFFTGLEPMRHPPIQLPALMSPENFRNAMMDWRNTKYVNVVNTELGRAHNVIVFAGFKHFGQAENGMAETIEERLRRQNGTTVSGAGYSI